MTFPLWINYQEEAKSEELPREPFGLGEGDAWDPAWNSKVEAWEKHILNVDKEIVSLQMVGLSE